MKRHILILVSLVCMAAFLHAQNARQAYTMQYAQIAVDEMHVSGIPASITLAQGILESGNGKSQLATMSNNHFGIKCHKGWNGKSVKYDDDAPKECFRKYDNPEQSFKDHSAFLSTRSRYASLFSLNKLDYKGWAKGLKKAGYATDPSYAHRLIRIIEDEALYTYDTMQSADVANYIAAKQRSYGQEPVLTASTGKSKNPTTQKKEIAKPASIPTASQDIDMGPAGTPELPAAAEKSRATFYQNNSKVVWARPGDSPSSLAQYYGISVKRLNKYNEWPDYINDFEAGMKVYLQPKRNKSQNVKLVLHKVLPGETMYKISQSYGIKMKNLLKLNQMNAGQQPAVGELIYLRKKRKTTPNLRQSGATNAIHKVEQPKVPVVETPVKEEAPEPVTVEATPPTPIVETQSPKLITSDTEETIEAKPTTTTAEDQQSGRAIIYDPTPEVNKRPAPTYIPPSKNGGTNNSPVINSGGAVSRPDGNNTSSIKHKVVRGDTLFGLASKYNVSVAQIKQWNSLTSNTIKLGQTLIIKK